MRHSSTKPPVRALRTSSAFGPGRTKRRRPVAGVNGTAAGTRDRDLGVGRRAGVAGDDDILGIAADPRHPGRDGGGVGAVRQLDRGGVAGEVDLGAPVAGRVRIAMDRGQCAADGKAATGLRAVRLSRGLVLGGERIEEFPPRFVQDRGWHKQALRVIHVERDHLPRCVADRSNARWIAATVWPAEKIERPPVTRPQPPPPPPPPN